MINTYKITLTPLDWYFFGGEITYGGSEQANYYAKSNKCPQESAIIGMLRYEILKKKDLLNASGKENEVADAIGNWGFNPLYGEESLRKIGLIDSISPVMIQYQGEVFNRAPLNYGSEIQFERTCVYLNGEKQQLPVPIKMQDAREIWISCLTGQPNENVVDDKIFISKSKIGITKQMTQRDDDNKDGYFKGEMYSLRKDYKFVFYARLGIELDNLLLVSLGAERSMFKMEVTPEKDMEQLSQLWDNMQIKPAELKQVVFFSEAFAPAEIYQHCSFAWTDTISFRCITRPWKADHNYAALDIKKERSCRYNLLRRGSVLYYETDEQEQEICKLINNEYFRNYGYNQCKLYK